MNKHAFLLFLLILSSSAFAGECPTPKGFDAANNELEWTYPTAKPITLVNLWAVWCPPCLKELPMLDSIAKNSSYAVENIHIGNNPDAVDKIFAKLEIQHLTKTIEPDFSILDNWGFQGLPATMVVVGGSVKYGYAGYIRNSSKEVEQWLECLNSLYEEKS